MRTQHAEQSPDSFRSQHNEQRVNRMGTAGIEGRKRFAGASHGAASGRRGAAMVLLAFMIVAIIGITAFAVDAGMMVLLRLQIQNAVDSGALAANLTLQNDPQAVDEAAAAAEDYIQRNRVGMAIEVPSDLIEVEVGQYDALKDVFTATTDEPNAINVFARQDKEPFFFAKIFGLSTYSGKASAIAAAGGPFDIMMVLDLSGSMGDEGRIEALQNSAPDFVDIIEQIGGNDKIGVMGLSADPSAYDPAARGHSGTEYNSGLHPTADHNIGVLEAALTDDFDDLRSNALKASNLTAGRYTDYTGTGAALGDAAHYLKNGSKARKNVQRVIVLMSDGHANRPTSNGPGYARSMASYAASNDVKVYTISLGNDADVTLMSDIATLTGGEHFDATGSGEAELTERLSEAFRRAAATIKRAQLVH